MTSLPVILAWLVVCLAAGGPHPDDHLKLVAPVAMPGALCLHFPTQKRIAIYCQTLGNYWKPLETVVETEETEETVNLIIEETTPLIFLN